MPDEWRRQRRQPQVIDTWRLQKSLFMLYSEYVACSCLLMECSFYEFAGLMRNLVIQSDSLRKTLNDWLKHRNKITSCIHERSIMVMVDWTNCEQSRSPFRCSFIPDSAFWTTSSNTFIASEYKYKPVPCVARQTYGEKKVSCRIFMPLCWRISNPFGNLEYMYSHADIHNTIDLMSSDVSSIFLKTLS